MSVKLVSLVRAQHNAKLKQKSTHICECFIWLPELGEQGKIIKYYFTEAKSTKQGVIGVDLSATHNDYATRPAAKQEPVTVCKANIIW